MLRWVLPLILLSTQTSCIYYVQQKREFYAYQTIDGERHIFPIDVQSVDSEDIQYCYEHETIHKIEVHYPITITTPSSHQ